MELYATMVTYGWMVAGNCCRIDLALATWPQNRRRTCRLGHNRAMTTPTVTPDEPADSVERFVRDLRSLYAHAENRPTFKQLGRLTHRSPSSIHAAVTYSDRLPSRATVEPLVKVLDPDHLTDWLARHARLDPRHHGTQEPPAAGPGAGQASDYSHQVQIQSASTSGAITVHRPRATLIAAVIAAGLVGAALTTPFDRGGVSTVAFCGGNYPRKDGRSGQVTTDGSWAAWRCELDDGTFVPVDMQLACRQQYPANGPFGGARYAVHQSQGLGSWRCYGALVHGW